MRWLAFIIAIFIIFLGAYWRIHHIDDQSLWHDEGNSLRLAERSVDDLIEATSRDIHPPGYYLILKGWTSVVGTTEFGLRSLSAFWGVITIAATYGLGKRLFNWQSATLASLLVAANPFAIYYAQETRMYAQLGALSILSLYFFVLLLEQLRLPIKRDVFNSTIFFALCLTFINTLGLYTQYTYPFTIIVQGIFFLWWWFQNPSRKPLQTYIALNLITLFLFIAWLPTAYDQITTWPSTGDMTPILDRLDRIFIILIYGQTISSLTAFQYLLPILLLIAVFIPFQIHTRKSHSVQWRIGLPLSLCLISISFLLLSGAYRETNLKFLLPAQSAIAILMGYGATQIAQLRFSPRLASNKRYIHLKWGLTTIALFLASLLCIMIIGEIGSLYTDPAFARSNYRGISNEIASISDANTAIILNAPNQQEVFTYYYDENAPIFPLPRGLGGDDDSTRQSTTQIIEDYQRIYLVLWGQQERDPNNIVQSTLDENAFVVGREWYNDVELVQYAVLDSPPLEPTYQTDILFGDNIMLEGYAVSDTIFQAGRGDALGLTLYWTTDTPLNTRYKVSVQVLNEFGGLVDQHDSEPANGRLITTDWQPNQRIIDNHGLVLNQNLTPGNYTLIVVVYDPNLSENNRLQPNDNDPNAVFTLTTLTLE